MSAPVPPKGRIYTPTLCLRPIVPSDQADVYAGLSDPAVTKYYAVSFDTFEATAEQMAWFEQPEQRWWAICNPDGDTFYGAGGINDIDLAKGSAEIGLWLLPAYWGRGILREALPAIATDANEQLGLRRIEGFVDAGNEKCRRAMAKLDFRHERTIKNFEEKAGQQVDVELYVRSFKDLPSSAALR